jgi:exosortase family protein XrtF
MSFKEFRPTIIFLVKFVIIYLAGNLIYGLYITSFEPRADPVTNVVAVQTGIVLNICGYRVDVEDRENRPTTDINYFGKAKLSIYEGCNGVNVMVIFIAFLFAFGTPNRNLLWFIPLGLMIIHFANLCRILLLFFVAEYLPKAMYFTHKYLFTAILYLVIFALWLWWIRSYSPLKKNAAG